MGSGECLSHEQAKMEEIGDVEGAEDVSPTVQGC